MEPNEFKHKLGAKVTITCSGEQGEVIGRAEYLADERRYWVRYQDATGRAVEMWWDESALT